MRKLFFIKDVDDIYKDVLVNLVILWIVEMKVLIVKNLVIYLLSKVLDLVFFEEEFRNMKGVRGLDKYKMDVFKGICKLNVV